MKQSVTYLDLMKMTPFFIRLNTDQLKWVIKNSTEWEMEAGTVISDSAHASVFIRVLPDGSWQIQTAGIIQKARHADPAKWYSAPAATLLPYDCHFIANQHSSVMRIRRTDFEEMIWKNFKLMHHLAEGKSFYQSLR